MSSSRLWKTTLVILVVIICSWLYGTVNKPECVLNAEYDEGHPLKCIRNMFGGFGKKLFDTAKDEFLGGGGSEEKKDSSRGGGDSGGGGFNIPGFGGGGDSGGGFQIPGFGGGSDKKDSGGGFNIPGFGGGSSSSGFSIPGFGGGDNKDSGGIFSGFKGQIIKQVGGAIIKQVASSMFSSGKKKYHKGWSSGDNSKYGYKGSTVRDSGNGSSTRAYKNASQEEPKSWEEIRDECVGNGTLWEDPDFTPCDSSLYFENPPVRGEVEWKRPSDIVGSPVMFDAEGASRLDVNQGVLGDCWLLAAVSCLATNQRLLHRVIPDDQTFNEGEYAGVFRFNIWQYGRWVEVLIDDLLPTYNGKLIYMHSDNKSEFWSALMEKAYAKLNSSYEALSGGLTSEALTDFTGGVVERFRLREEAPDDLLKRMLKAHQRYSMMGCSIDASPDQMESQLDNGLIIGHAYSITDVKMIEDGQVALIRIRNPWGDSHEWKGAWSDESDEWNNISEEDREGLGLSFEHDGEFWMSYEDFKTEFQRLEVCYLGPDTLAEGDEVKPKFEGALMEGAWKRNVNSGGCANYPSFHTNPQYKIHIEDPDDDDDDGNCTIIVGVMQKDRRKMRAQGKHDLTIGYAIYQVPDPDIGTLGSRFFRSTPSSGKSPNFINMREVSGHHALPAGDYVILPSTFEPGQEGDFVVRVFSEKENSTGEVDDATGQCEPDPEDVPADDDDEEGSRDSAKEAFLNLAGEDGEIDAYEIADILNGVFQKQFEFDGFSTDMCRGMVAMFDADLSGKLGYQDFIGLWTDLNTCKKVFKHIDSDGNGYFSSYELRRALNALGLKMSNSTFNAVAMRYSNKEGQVKFDDFVACYTKLKIMFATFNDKDPQSDGTAVFEMDEFIQMTMYS